MTGDETARLALWRDQIDDIVTSVRDALAPAHPDVLEARFPFAIHHSVTRRRIREPSTRRSPKHAEICSLLVRWAAENGGASPYAWQCISVALTEMSAATASPELSAVLKQAQIGPLVPFLEWAKADLQDRALAAAA